MWVTMPHGRGVTPCDLQREGGGGICSVWQGMVGTPEREDRETEL